MEAGVLIFADATPEQIQWQRELYQRKKDMLQIQNTEKDFNVKERGGILYGNNHAYMNMEFRNTQLGTTDSPRKQILNITSIS